MGISDADAYFGKVVFTGSHENAMLALGAGHGGRSPPTSGPATMIRRSRR